MGKPVKEPLTCIVADDHPALAKTVCDLLEENGIVVVGRAREGEEAAALIESRIDDARDELVGLGRGRTALAGYAGPAAPVAELDWQG